MSDQDKADQNPYLPCGIADLETATADELYEDLKRRLGPDGERGKDWLGCVLMHLHAVLDDGFANGTARYAVIMARVYDQIVLLTAEDLNKAREEVMSKIHEMLGGQAAPGFKKKPPGVQ